MMQAEAQQPVHSNLMTSALPSEGDFFQMATQGYEVVISLCENSDSVTLGNEDRLVTDVGMKYLHLPIDFEAPQVSDYELVRDILNLFSQKKVWLHCTKNHRVSAMIYLYNVLERGVPRDTARVLMETIWEPSEVWWTMIHHAMEKYAYQYL